MAGELSSAASDAAPIEASLVRPVQWREVSSVLLWTLLADLLIFRAFGLGGPAVFFALVPLVFLFGIEDVRRDRVWMVIVGLLAVVSMRLVWAGSALTVFSGVALVVALAMSSAGSVPLVLEGFVLAGRAVVDGARRLGLYRLPRKLRAKAGSSGRVMAWTLPAAAVVVFGSIFVFANPDLFDWVSTRVARLGDSIRLWLANFSFWEIPFCVLALLLGAGLLRPAFPMFRIGPVEPETAPRVNGARSMYFVAFRNMLATLIVLFAVYLIFEFVTLWKREFPTGFYYAGYAHQGAAWLTFALALATAVLSLVFSRATLQDDRLDQLRRLAWIWSAENLLLAVAVYNRLTIYVGYNGMTRLRTVAFFGTTVVVVGFALVVYKICRNRGFWWLIRAQLIALLMTVVAYSVFPVDYIAHRYNVATVASGYRHPSVMIAVKPIDDEGVLPLMKLTDFEDPIIRDGVRALLAQRQHEIEAARPQHWSEFQGSRAVLKERLLENQSRWAEFRTDAGARAQALARFRDYAMRWY